MATAPPDLTASALNGATSDQLRFWIQQANNGAGKKVLNKTGKVEELRSRLADHYNLDRSHSGQHSAPVAGPPSLNQDIQNRQERAHLRDLGVEWEQASRAGRVFKLCPPPEGKC